MYWQGLSPADKLSTSWKLKSPHTLWFGFYLFGFVVVFFLCLFVCFMVFFSLVLVLELRETRVQQPMSFVPLPLSCC